MELFRLREGVVARSLRLLAAIWEKGRRGRGFFQEKQIMKGLIMAPRRGGASKLSSDQSLRFF